ncbi:MAG: hypothetical protein DRR16_21355 [Candidatus Parabeggiatoa sp. nov. 3]|nr:MAG: hypothetical protein DRR00_27080 [Gammaproteobacteria bacterium]RKZ58186.1 MAG: hypothetical protein DRQ99_25830 [Gammaproteobacteria bacterium]RKZ81774.1 MAG: hypothetical protein DRR16_21355 [Gammaproteobacteria bacterium]
MKKSLRRGIIIGIISVSVCSASFAATVIKRSDIQGKEEKITLEKQHVRIQGENANYYRLMDLKLKKVYQVDDKQKRILEMDIEGKPPKLPEGEPPPWFGQEQAPVKAHLAKSEYVTDIAGYSSRYYQIMVLYQNKWRPCFDNYFSETAAKVPYLVDFINALSQISQSRQIEGMPVHPCLQALDNLESEMKKLGVPMKTLIKGNKGDKVKHEILNIQTDVKVSPELFKVPDYHRITEQEKREEVYKEMRKRMEEAQKRGYK